MKTIFLNFLKPVSFLILTIGVLIACNKKPETIGLDLVDANKPFVGTDTTFDVFAYSVREDSVRADETSNNLLGSRYSETFGLANAGFYSQLRLSLVNPDFGDTPVADSIIFSMVYKGYYGNINSQQTVRIYQMDTIIKRDSIFWSNSNFGIIDTAELANYSFVPNPSDSVEVDTVTKIAARLRIPMDLSFGQRLLNADSSVYETSETFIDYFNGIYVQAEDMTSPGEGSILYFDLVSDYSNVTVYYHNNDSTDNDSLSYSFVINTNCSRVNRIQHNYEQSLDYNFKQQILAGDTNLGMEKLFVQGMGGVRTVIKFPGLTEWLDSGSVVINEAKLVMTSMDYTEENDPSLSMLLFNTNENGDFLVTVDQSTQGDDYFGGVYDEGSQSYYFRISLHLQDLMSGEPDYGLSLFSNGKSIWANETVLYGTQAGGPQKFRLYIIYSKAG
ncbi:MAG: DUF4270 domain-containing protein [Bacteroidales bacterium]